MSERLTCNGCVYYKQWESAAQGHCHRYPPVLIHDKGLLLSEWPQVMSQDFCGDGFPIIKDYMGCK